jgi:YfdX protein
MIKKKLTTTALLAVISTGLAATALTPVDAAELQQPAAENTAEQKQADQDFIKVSEDAQMTMRNVGGARLAIFNGSPDKAQIYADAAVTRAASALKDADKYALDIKASKKDGQKYVPFNAGLTVAETLKPSKEKLEHITRANMHLHKGETRKAIETLKVAGIDVALNTELLPIQTARTHIVDAAKLIGEGKYYEANLALKAVEDSVVTEVFNTDSIPQTRAKS